MKVLNGKFGLKEPMILGQIQKSQVKEQRLIKMVF